MANSTWTMNNISSLLDLSESTPDDKRPRIVYPPCNIASFANLSLHDRKPTILSVAQFRSVEINVINKQSQCQNRPEKEHAAQIRALAVFKRLYPRDSAVKLVLAGSARNKGDEKRVEELRALAKDLVVSVRTDLPSIELQLTPMQDDVIFVVNAPYSELMKWFGSASIGISTMVDEHFGINVVEIMVCPSTDLESILLMIN